jgi:hypothetical protein
MDIDTRITHVKGPDIAKPAAIGAKLSVLFGMTLTTRKPQRCSVCTRKAIAPVLYPQPPA